MITSTELVAQVQNKSRLYRCFGKQQQTTLGNLIRAFLRSGVTPQLMYRSVWFASQAERLTAQFACLRALARGWGLGKNASNVQLHGLGLGTLKKREGKKRTIFLRQV